MATNGIPGDNRRHGAVKQRCQVFNPKTEQWVKRDINTGKFIDVKQNGELFRGVKKERQYGKYKKSKKTFSSTIRKW